MSTHYTDTEWLEIQRSHGLADRPMKRLQTGYHTLCSSCRTDFADSRENSDLHIVRHGAADATKCANCNMTKHSNELSSCRVWYAEVSRYLVKSE